MATHRINRINSIFQLLRITFIILPIAAGIDKFANFLTDWIQYLNPLVTDVLSLSADSFMNIAGIIEIIAGIIVAITPKFGGYLVFVWLLLIAFNLLIGRMYLDIAMRDIVMAIAALSMANLASK